MKHWGKIGAFWVDSGAALWSAFFAIPGIGPFLSQVHWLAGLSQALRGGCCRGVSALGAGLVSIGIPKDSVIKYEAALKTDKFL